MSAWQSIGGFHPHNWTENLHLIQFKHLFWRGKRGYFVCHFQMKGVCFHFQAIGRLFFNISAKDRDPIMVVPIWDLHMVSLLLSYRNCSLIPNQTFWPLWAPRHTVSYTWDPRDTPHLPASRIQNYPYTVSGGFLWTRVSPTLSPLEVAKAVSLSL